MHSTTSAASGRRPPPSTLRPAGNGCSAKKWSRELIRRSRGLLERLELTDEPASTDVTLGQWALLDDDGNERDSGPGRATVQLSYAF